MRVLVVDDHPVICRGIQEALLEAYPGAQIDRAGTANEALQRLRAASADVAVLDITLPGRSGLDLLADLRTMYPQVQAIVVSMHPEERYAVRAFKMGAAGYVTKDMALEEIVQAIDKVRAGGRYVSRSLAERLAQCLSGEVVDRPHEALSEREHEILLRIAAGKGVTEIAAELSLSVKTVSTYRSRVLRKLGMRTNAELIRYALEAGLAV